MKNILKVSVIAVLIFLSHLPRANAQMDSIAVIRDSTLMDSYVLRNSRYFAISTAEVQQAELAIKQFIQRDANGPGDVNMKPLYNYLRTYAGLQLEDSLRIAYVVGRCHPIPGWERSISLPKGGGNCCVSFIEPAAGEMVWIDEMN